MCNAIEFPVGHGLIRMFSSVGQRSSPIVMDRENDLFLYYFALPLSWCLILLSNFIRNESFLFLQHWLISIVTYILILSEGGRQRILLNCIQNLIDFPLNEHWNSFGFPQKRRQHGEGEKKTLAIEVQLEENQSIDAYTFINAFWLDSIPSVLTRCDLTVL